MKRDELKSIQAPLKEKYKSDPSSGFLTLKAQGRLGEGITCKIETGKTMVEAGLHPYTGGNGVSICSADMLLEALVSCAGVTLNAVATSMGIEIRSGIVRAEGDLDFRGTLGVSREVPVGFQKIRIYLDIDADATEDQKAALIRLTERYCVVFQTLRVTPEIELIGIW